MKIVITGSNGQLGTQLQKILKDGFSEIGAIAEDYKNCEVLPIDIDELDITDKNAVCQFISANKPDVVINCAAMTNVDACETEFEIAMKVNAIGPRNLAIACSEIGAKLIHVSTDYDFGGTGTVPYREWDICNPQSVYGASKYLGEQYVREFCDKYFIVRTSWLYGYIGKNFVKTMVRLGRSRDSISVVNDQRGNPTNAEDLAHHLLKLAVSEQYGVYHCTGEGECTWYDFACKIMQEFGIDCKVNPCTSDEFPSPTKRPEFSSLDNLMLKCTVGNEMRNWEEALSVYAKNIDESELN